ncbi:hypothetical protein [Corynebacterium kroppenstedtii]|uniref:hypothetical protein n=1 Tax=Corynebacterium kroppenstedtii TaxID=161879 RepID=UPI0026F174D1|nr:hypothetical protein [Corynebacterium kroppenstedtii]MDU7286445.1 hypothetical protein [Corynebacterium kroppenstedtii]
MTGATLTADTTAQDLYTTAGKLANLRSCPAETQDNGGRFDETFTTTLTSNAQNVPNLRVY